MKPVVIAVATGHPRKLTPEGKRLINMMALLADPLHSPMHRRTLAATRGMSRTAVTSKGVTFVEHVEMKQAQ